MKLKNQIVLSGIPLVIFSIISASLSPAIAVPKLVVNFKVRTEAAEERVKEKKEAVKEKVEAEKKKMRVEKEKIKTRKENIKTRAEEKKEKLKGKREKIRKRIASRILQRAQRIIRRLNQIVKRFDKIFDKIQNRIQKMQERGFDISSLDPLIEEAKSKSETAKNVTADMESQLSSITEAEDPKVAVEEFVSAMKTARTAIKEYHKSLGAIVRQMRTIRKGQKPTIIQQNKDTEVQEHD